MTARGLIGPAFTFVVTLSAMAAEAAPVLLVDTNGKLIGAQNVQVGASVYDVGFWDGTCGVLFRTCDLSTIDVGLPDFAFTTAADASAAAQALLDQVFLDTASGNFDTGISTIRGCVIREVCTAYVPFSFRPAGPLSDARVESAGAVNYMSLSTPDEVDPSIVSNLNFNTSPPLFGLDAFVWARFTLAGTGPVPDPVTPVPDPVTPVPEPTSALILGSGLTAAMLRHFRRRSTSPANPFV